MWRLFNKWFGWDYAAVEFGYSWYIRRVYKAASGKSFVMIAGEPRFLCKSDKTRNYAPLTYVED